MNDQLSLVSLILEASLVVQLVMLVLALASLVSWALIIQRWLGNRAVADADRAFEEDFWSGMDIARLYEEGEDQGAVGMEAIFRSGFSEYRPRLAGGGLLEATERALRVGRGREVARLEHGLSFLATVGSVSPYIGLFGTVWGIMNAFRGLAYVQQATLAAVAPGIAEALVATAMGLFAAIPAVVAYNHFSAQADAVDDNYRHFSDEFTAILQGSAAENAP